MRIIFLVSCFLLSHLGRAQSANTWTLNTDDTRVTVAVEQNRPVLKELRSPKPNHSWLSSPSPEVLLPSIIQGGQAKQLDWKFRTSSLDGASGELTLEFENATPRLQLKSVWRARPGHGPVEHWLTITNNSGSAVTLGHQDSLVLTGLSLPSGKGSDAWWINRGGSNASTEGGTFTEPISGDFDQVLTSDPSNGSSPVPWFAIQTGTTHGIYVGWEFSGIGRIHAKAAASNSGSQRLDLRVGNVPEFKTDLPAGETFLVPPAFAGCYSGDIDDGSYTLHRFVLEKLLPARPKAQPYPTLAYNLYLDAGGDKAKEQDVLNSAATCKSLGFETFVPDAMWFPQAGDWRWDRARFPHSFLPVEQYVHQNQMQFGLWVAWTQGGNSKDPGALSVRDHPDWFVKNFTPDEKMDYLHWNVLMDLGYDPARNWAERETERIVSEFKLDYLKHDYSPIVTECQQTNHRHRYAVDVSYWSTLGYYRVQEKLRQKFPDLILEGCSGGGHIKDFGYIHRVHYIVTTDTLSSLPDRQSFYDSTFVLPPAVLQAYTYENYYNKDADRPRPYFWRSAMMGAWQIDPTKVASWSDQERADVKKATDLYKSWIRPMLQDVEVHHILPRPDGYHWDGMFYWSPSLKHGTLYIFRPNNDQLMQTIHVKGLEPEKRYRIHSEGDSVAESTHSGADLMKTGLKVTLPGKYTSDLVYVEEK